LANASKLLVSAFNQLLVVEADQILHGGSDAALQFGRSRVMISMRSAQWFRDDFVDHLKRVKITGSQF